MTLQLQKHNHLMIFTKASCLPTTSFPGGSVSKEYTCNGGDLGSIPGSGKSPGEGSILARRIPWTDKPGRLQSMRSQELGIS